MIGHRRYLWIPCWNMVFLAAWIFFFGKFTTPGRTLACVLPTFVAMVALWFLFIRNAAGK